jgi:hypothetical protein
VKLLLDEMHSASLAEALRTAGSEAVTVAELALAGRSDLDVFAAAVAEGYVLLTENVADFARDAPLVGSSVDGNGWARSSDSSRVRRGDARQLRASAVAHEVPANRTFRDGRGGFRTCDLSRVKHEGRRGCGRRNTCNICQMVAPVSARRWA